jgi:hypothetical protein
VLTTETLRRPYSVLHAVAFCDAACSKKFNWEADHSTGVGLHDWCVRRPPMHLLVPMAVFYVRRGNRKFPHAQGTSGYACKVPYGKCDTLHGFETLAAQMSASCWCGGRCVRFGGRFD